MQSILNTRVPADQHGRAICSLVELNTTVANQIPLHITDGNGDDESVYREARRELAVLTFEKGVEISDFDMRDVNDLTFDSFCLWPEQ